MERVAEVASRFLIWPSRIIGPIEAISAGGGAMSWPRKPARRLRSHRTETKTWLSCQNVARTPSRKTKVMKPFR